MNYHKDQVLTSELLLIFCCHFNCISRILQKMLATLFQMLNRDNFELNLENNNCMKNIQNRVISVCQWCYTGAFPNTRKFTVHNIVIFFL